MVTAVTVAVTVAVALGVLCLLGRFVVFALQGLRFGLAKGAFDFSKVLHHHLGEADDAGAVRLDVGGGGGGWRIVLAKTG